MTGDTIVRLASAMESHPAVALIQTLPIVVNARTLFARLQQFSGRLYGPLIAAGIAWWHGSEGNYWGHNAIIRVRAFAQDAGLPDLKGRKPFGGHILSHDFVEAALMRRGGWAIRMAPTLGGSFEECPPSLLDFAARDRRWCQGNLQHLAVLPARGLHWVSRLHLLTGIGSYLTAPLWLMFLVLGILISLQAQFVRPEYFPKGFSLFPKWPAQDPVLAAWVFVGTMGLLIAAETARLHSARDTKPNPPAIRRRLVGSWRAPDRDLAVGPDRARHDDLSIHRGRRNSARPRCGLAGSAPRRRRVAASRVDAQICLADAVRNRHGRRSPMRCRCRCLFWMAPVIVGLLLCIPIAMLSSMAFDPKSRLFRTPEQTDPPAVLVRANELAQASSGLAPSSPLLQLRDDHNLLETHLIESARRPAPPSRPDRSAPGDCAGKDRGRGKLR